MALKSFSPFSSSATTSKKICHAKVVFIVLPVDSILSAICITGAVVFFVFPSVFKKSKSSIWSTNVDFPT